MSNARNLSKLLGTDTQITTADIADGVFQANKNRIINGAMVIDQRNSGASITITNTVAYTYTVDRWGAYTYPTGSKFSVQQNAGSVTPPVGFTKYLGVTSLSAHSIGSSDIHIVRHAIEGFNVADLGWGSANAKSVTLSFWVRSSLTGAFGGSFNNGQFNRSYPFSYTISAANTWEQKKITISGDTSGSWVTDNTLGINLNLGLGVGSSYSGTAGSWASGDYRSSTGTTSVVGTNGATFYVTGVQLEVGEQATPFEHRSYSEELAACQRYYWQLSQSVHGNYPSWIASAYSTTQMNIQIPFPVTMRSIPTMTYNTGNVNYYRFYRNSANHNFGTVGTDTVTSEHINLYGTATSSHTAGTSGTLQIRLADGAGVFASAEL